MSVRSVEIDSLADFDARIGRTNAVNGWFVSSLDLRSRSAALLRVDPRGAVFLGCRFAETPVDVAERLRSGGALLFPHLPDVPFDPYRPHLYSPRSSTASRTGAGLRTTDPRTTEAPKRSSTAGPVRRPGAP